MQLPSLECHIRDWTRTDFDTINLSRSKLEHLTQNVSKRSSAFKNACRKLLTFAIRKSGGDISSAIKRPIDSRAASYLIARSDAFRAAVTINSKLLKSIESPRPKLSGLTLRFLIEAYLNFFDELGAKSEVDALRQFLLSHLAQFQRKKASSDLVSLVDYRELVFAADGPNKLVEWAIDQASDLDMAFRVVGIHGYKEGRFLQICRYRYYLETLRSIPTGENHDVLAEVCKPHVYQAPGKDGNLLGHEVLSILIDRSKGAQAISDEWQKVVLTIAGDPRVPKSSASFQQWWALLGEDRVNLIRGWLSRFDLGLFLKVLDNYGKSSGDRDLQRMFPSRKCFLEGLIEQGLVSQSRLFVNPRAENYLKKNYEKDELPEYAKVKDTYRSMIYLQVGDLHLIEGSHSFKLWIFPYMPKDSRVLDYGVSLFTPPDISTDLERRYLFEFNHLGHKPVSIIHTPSRFSWQHNAIVYMSKMGLRLDIEKLFSPKDYAQYKRFYGI